ncbi:MAG: insulinase family protein [Bacteroidetes bacterium]|nr:insulinase family protein [Bacteroidota bacterium]
MNQVIRASSDEDFSKMGLEDFLFRNTNYQTMVDGTTLGLEKITLESVKSHYRDFFSSANLTIGIAGNYPPKFTARLQEAMQKLPQKNKEIPAITKVASPDGINVEIIAKENAMGSAIFMGFPLPVTRTDDEFAALMVANSWLGEHRKSYSRLYQKIREARSMNYGDYSYIEWYENGGQNMLPPPGVPRSNNYFSIWIRPVQTGESLRKQYSELAEIKTGHAHFAIRMALREMQMLIDNGLTDEDFELTKKFLLSYMKLYIQTPSRQLGYLMDSKFYGRKDYIAEMQTLLQKLSLDDVNNAIKKYWQTQRMFITIVTDDSEATPLYSSLMNNEKSPMSYSDQLKSTLPPELLREDEAVSGYSLNIRKVSIVKAAEMFR